MHRNKWGVGNREDIGLQDSWWGSIVKVNPSKSAKYPKADISEDVSGYPCSPSILMISINLKKDTLFWYVSFI